MGNGLLYVFSELGLALAIAAGHRLIDTGPYRFVRHPSYTGALMAFLDYMHRTKRLVPAVY